MRILITGAYGFIGQYIAAALRAAGHEIIAGIRNPQRWHALFPQEKAIACDFNADIDVNDWVPRLEGIDAVVNCVGILQERHRKESMEAIHYLAPKALFTACAQKGISKLIQISALGADKAANNCYAQTKNAAEEYLQTLTGNWIILRPSLVYAIGSAGGMSLFRALAAIPWRVPLVGAGQQNFQPIYVKDLARAVRNLITDTTIVQQCFDAVGPEQVSLQTLLLRLRQWLQLGKARFFQLPVAMIRIAAKLGDWTKIGPLNSTTYAMLQYGNTTSTNAQQAFNEAIKFSPRDMLTVFRANPAQQQDRWHARLYFLQPALRYSLAFVWIATGIISLVNGEDTLAALGVKNSVMLMLLYGAIAWDLGLGCATLINWQIRIVSMLQFLTILIYTIICSFWLPGLWLNLFGPLLKNIPLLAATLMMAVFNE